MRPPFHAAYPDSVSVEHLAGELLEVGQVCSRCGGLLDRHDLEPGTRVHCKAGVWAPAPGVVPAGPVVPCFPQPRAT